MGALPPWTPLCPPSWAEDSPAFWGVNLSPGPSPRRRGENPAKFSLFPRREGGQGVRSERHTPDNPLDPPFDKFGLCHYNHARWNGLTFGAG